MQKDMCKGMHVKRNTAWERNGKKMAHILAVDDEPDILRMIRKILEKDGHSVEVLSEPVMMEKRSWSIST